MPAKKSNAGICTYCNAPIAKRSNSIEKHLHECPEQLDLTVKSPPEKCFLLMVQSENPAYWMLVKVTAETKLQELDAFLRDIWLECCGHLSEFSYDEPFTDTTIEMSKKLKNVLSGTDEFWYVYDYGSSTNLRIQLFGLSELWKKENPITILMRNKAPEAACQHCGKPADGICTQCMWEGDNPFVCEWCQGKHPCVEDEEGDSMISGIVNSPRMGECAYDDSCFVKSHVEGYFPRGIV